MSGRSRMGGVLATAGEAAALRRSMFSPPERADRAWGGSAWDRPRRPTSAYAYELRADEPARISDTITPSGSVPQ